MSVFHFNINATFNLKMLSDEELVKLQKQIDSILQLRHQQTISTDFNINDWIVENTQTKDKWLYIPAKTIPKQHKKNIIEALTDKGFKYSKCMFADLSKRGYKMISP